MGFFDFLTGARAQAADALAPQDFLDRYQPGDALLDVRTPGEFAQGHLADATNVNVQAPAFLAQVARLGLDQDAPVYLYCRSGNRSGQAARMLRAEGYTAAYNVGGYEALKRAGAK